jgi:hypothetical protein
MRQNFELCILNLFSTGVSIRIVFVEEDAVFRFLLWVSVMELRKEERELVLSVEF